MGWMNHLDRLIRGKQTSLVRNRTINIGRKVHSPLENALSGTSRGEVFVDNRVVSAKYTIWNFIPKNLFEQFRRIANFYFLCIAIIQMSIDSPVNPATSSLPLVFVITVTAIKQGYEDWLRHRNDREVNLRLVDVVHQGSIQQVQSQNIHVGDIVRVKRDESFPCDLVLVSTSNNEGKCYITTANLDGETNLKTHYSPKETRQLKTTEQLSAFSACIECQNPTPDLYKFMGTLKIFGDADIENPQLMTKVSLGLENTLFRGARLKDTEFIYGCAVYTGQDTKMAQNSKLTSNKFSTVEKTMNMFLLFFLSILVIEISVCTALKYKMWFSPTIADAWYLNANHSAPVRDVLQDVFSFLVVFNYIIPISLYVTLEMQKFIGSLFFAWDEELRCPITGEIPICNSSDLNEELGQVQYLFTDKTGTLTENNMEFRQCSIAGLKHMEKEGDLFAALDNSARHFNPVHHFTGYLEEFFVGLALCHTVQVSIPTSSKREEVVSSLPGYVNNTFHPDHFDYTYQASSPDEKALVEACRRLGIVFHGEEDGLIRLTVFGQDRYYRRLQVLEFDSDRKRMSTIVLFPDDSIWLVCKGAESTIVPNCIGGPINQTLEHINDYALLGLRTLAVSARRLTSDQYADMMEKLNEARQVMVDRELCVSRIFDFIESDMTLLGATGVEDQLQDGVAETLEALRAAGIKIWVLTGDKLETAINIAYSCGHFKRGMQLLTLTAQTSPAECQETLWRLRRRIWDEPIQNFGFVVDGESLAHSLKEHRQLLSEVCSHCNTVVCCRMSPIQKAEVVKVVKGFSSKPITAAIGDGANDVSMIQEAHVGIGIMGKEGRQAVRCSDFAFARFRFLRRVLLVHGHWYYWRVSTLVQYFFYKNITFITPAVFFAIFSAYSTQPIYDTFFLTFYNIFFTSWPILIFGLLEQNFTSRQLLENLHLYRDITNNARMSWFQFFKWTLLGLWHSVVIFFGCILLWESETPFDSRGLILDFWSFGTLVYSGVIVVVSLKLVLQSRHWTAPFVISILLSVFGFMGLTFLYCLFTVDALNNGPLKWVYMNMLSTGPVWLFIVFGVVVALLPDILIGVWEAYSAGEGVLVNQRYQRRIDHNLSTLTSVTVVSWATSWSPTGGTTPALPDDRLSRSCVNSPPLFTTIDVQSPFAKSQEKVTLDTIPKDKIRTDDELFNDKPTTKRYERLRSYNSAPLHRRKCPHNVPAIFNASDLSNLMENFRRWRQSTRKAAANRFIFVGNAVPQNASPPAEYDRQKFCDNEIVSSKYTALNFLPKNLFEQFRRIANFYFLCIAIIQIVSDSPTSPITSILPLIFVVVVTAVKQGYEDFLRHRNDRQVNEQLIDVVRNGELQKVKSKDIHVGDVLRIEEDDSFPCDLVLLASSYAEGKCYLTTANLDGETNYKMKSCPKLTRDFNDPEKMDRLRAHIQYQQPTVNLYQFVGTLTVYSTRVAPEDSSELLASSDTDGGVASLGLDNLLLRGARLKDTDFVYGCAVYTGQDTKLGLNSLLTNNKFSTVEKSMNYFLLAFLVLLIFEIALCTIQKYAKQPYLADAFYLGELPPTSFGGVMQDLASFLIIFNYVIPISLYVTLEMQKFLGTIFFVWDDDLYCPVADERAVCNTSDLNEELGQVEYLLTDKTGTLTENCMEFRQCSIGGTKYIEEDCVLMRATDNSATSLERVEEFSAEVEDFLITLALCHTVTITGNNKRKKKLRASRTEIIPGMENTAFQFHRGDYDYQASSPDEKALAEACQRLDMVYCGETNDICRILFQGQERLYSRLHVLEFDSDRKRMSVILQFPDDSIWLLCKGAESAILPRCDFGPVSETESHIKDYAMMGLRTLAIAVRPLSAEDYEEISFQLDQAHQALTDREKKVSEVCDLIESHMTLLGATGVEDQLQDGVPETLESLRAAGIKVWVLTGDKLETAVNIAHSCGHFKRGTELLVLSDPEKTEETLENLEKKIIDTRDRHFGMVVDGQCLAVALKQHRDRFSQIARHCEAVVCCRMSPIQKAEVVKLVKGFPGKPITAAIGDGANDVSMIQEAHIGLGLMGKEGRQAVRCADFAFARFRFLRKVLLVHGHWYYWRVSSLVQYFFYKNIAFITPVVFFTIHSAYSTQPVYDPYFLTFYNILFTSLPILIYGLFEQNFTAPQLLEHLHLYKDITKNALMSWGQFFKWNLLGVWHSIVVYFGCLLLWQSDPAFFDSGITLDYWSFGTLIYHAVIFIVSIKLAIESRYWTALFIFSILISIIGFIGLTFLYSGVVFNALDNEQMLFVYVTVLSTGSAWLFTLFSIVTALLPDFLVAVWETYSVGGGVLVNKRHTPGQIVRKKLNRTYSLLSQSRLGKFVISKKRGSSSSERPQPTSYETRRSSNLQTHRETCTESIGQTPCEGPLEV